MARITASTADRISTLVAEIEAEAYARGRADARSEMLKTLGAAEGLNRRTGAARVGRPGKAKRRTGGRRRAPRGSVRRLVERVLGRASRLDAARNSRPRRRRYRAFGQAGIDPGRIAQRAETETLPCRQRPLVAGRRIQRGRRTRSHRHVRPGGSGNRREGRRGQARPVLVIDASAGLGPIPNVTDET